jgi:alanine-glyoxylate transaminase / serine-glyoxylate transaminase / serine-pyruvate transaminase
MLQLDQHPSGRHFLQIPGPSPVPDRILRAMSLPTIDHRGPEFGVLGLQVLEGMQQIFQTRHPVAIYPASGTGAWEAALVNTLSARRCGADVRDRPLRQPVAQDGTAPGLQPSC